MILKKREIYTVPLHILLLVQLIECSGSFVIDIINYFGDTQLALA